MTDEDLKNLEHTIGRHEGELDVMLKRIEELENDLRLVVRFNPMQFSRSHTLRCSAEHITVKRLRIRRPLTYGEQNALWPTTQRSVITGTATGFNVHEEYELRYWTKELGVTPEKLKQTVEKAGVMVTDVRKALGK